LLSRKWCPPRTPPLIYKPDAPLLAAAFGPGNDPIAVSDDGNLLRWKRDSSSPSESKSLIAATRIKSAAFSSDGRLLLFTPSAKGGDVELWKWNGSDFAYDQALDLTNRIGFAPMIRQALWSSDRRVLIVISGRFDKPVFDVFQLEDGIYVAVSPMPFPKAVAANFDRSGRALATVDESGDVQLWDATSTLSMSERIPVTVAPEVRVSGIEFVPGTNYLVATGFRGGYWLDTKSRKQGSLEQPLTQDLFMRFAFAPKANEVRFAVGLSSRIVFVRAQAGALDLNKEIKSPVYEPIAIRGISGTPVFSQDGSELLTLSGAVWNAWDTLRIWDVSGPKVPDEMVAFDRLDPVPPWLADLAITVTGFCSADPDEEEPLTLERIRAKTSPHDIRGQYEYVWRRFFGELPSK
jgi:WD40 repeat protein